MRSIAQQTFIDQVRQANLIEAVIAEDTALHQEGRLLKGRCPLHGDQDASLAVYPENQSYYCFGCGAGGDVFSWVAARNNGTFVEALEYLADRAGLTRDNLSTEERERFESDQRLRRQIQQALDAAARFYEERLWGPTGERARAYLKSRGFSEETMRRFRMGWAPGGQELQKTLALQGIWIEAMQKAGLLASYPGTSGYYDLLHDAIVIPITEYHQVVSLYGRIIKPGEQSPHRYLNGRTNTGLFNLHALRGHKSIILPEALIDAVSFAQVGYPNVTVAYGTRGFSESHAVRLRNAGVEEIILGFDSDADTTPDGKEKKSGQKAALDQAGQLLRLGFDVRIVSWPRADPQQKLDANRYLQDGAGQAEFQAVIDAALAPAEFRELWQVNTELPLLAVKDSALTYRWGSRLYHAESVAQSDGGMRATVTLYVGGHLVHKDTLGLHSAQRRNAFAKCCAADADLTEVNRDLLALEAELRKASEQPADRSPDRDASGPRSGSADAPTNIRRPATDFNLTDLGNAKRLVARHGAALRFCYAWDRWLVWDGSRWAPDATGEIVRRAKDAVVGIYAEATDEPDEKARKAIAAHAMRSESAQKIKAMVTLAESEPGMPVTPDELDGNPWLLNCANGTIDLRTGELLPHRQDDLLTKSVPVDYDPAARAPTWDAFLDRIMAGNRNLIGFLQRAIGYALTGSVAEQCMFILHGFQGKNGKSTFLETISAMLAGYALHVQTETLMLKRNDGGASADVARLKGARFISAVEADDGKRLSEALVKQLTGGDTVAARFLYSDLFEFRMTGKIFMATNHKPIIRGTDNAIWRRIQLVPFAVTIDKPDKHLPDKLRAEFPGILRWAVEGCLAWQKDGLGLPDEVQAATQEYRQEMDTLAQFLTDCCVLRPELTSKAKELYLAYATWCNENGEPPVSQKRFGQQLGERGYQAVRTSLARLWKGIGLMSYDQRT